VVTPVSGVSHNQDPDSASVCVTIPLAAQTREKPSHLFAHTLADLPDDAKLCLGRQDTIKKMIHGTRCGRHSPVPDSAHARLFTLYQNRQTGRKAVTALLPGVGYNI